MSAASSGRCRPEGSFDATAAGKSRALSTSAAWWATMRALAEVLGSLWDTQTSRQTASVGGTGKTTAQMKVRSYLCRDELGFLQYLEHLRGNQLPDLPVADPAWGSSLPGWCELHRFRMVRRQLASAGLRRLQSTTARAPTWTAPGRWSSATWPFLQRIGWPACNTASTRSGWSGRSMDDMGVVYGECRRFSGGQDGVGHRRGQTHRQGHRHGSGAERRPRRGALQSVRPGGPGRVRGNSAAGRSCLADSGET